jgi:hypothetical protein
VAEAARVAAEEQQRLADLARAEAARSKKKTRSGPNADDDADRSKRHRSDRI